MTRFLFIASDYKPKPGGIAAYLDCLARGLIALGNTVHVLGVIPPEDKVRAAFLENYEPWVSPFPMAYDKRPENWLGNNCVSLLEMVRCSSPALGRVLDRTQLFRSTADAVARLKEFVAKYRPDVIILGHLDLFQYPLVLFLREQQLPYGIIAHDVEIQRNPHRMNDLYRRGMMVKEAAWIAANSRHTKLLLEQWGIDPNRIKIIHPPISQEAIDVSSVMNRNDREASPIRLVTISRLVKAKGIDIVLRAMSILRANRIPVEYVIAGGGEAREYLEGLVDELGLRDCVRFAGQITEAEKWEILRNSDVYVMPSRVDPFVQHEGFGISFIEAAAFAVPGVGSSGGGIPDAIIDGETGILVPQESPEKIAETLSFFYSNPETMRKMGYAARERARKLFSPATVAAHFQNEVTNASEPCDPHLVRA